MSNQPYRPPPIQPYPQIPRQGQPSSSRIPPTPIRYPPHQAVGSSNGSRNDHVAVKREYDSHTEEEGELREKRKRTKRSTGKACVYCRRSHMVCEGGRPCERCVKREIAHLCRDVTPPPERHASERHPSESSQAPLSHQARSPPHVPLQVPPPRPASSLNTEQPRPQLPTSLYADPNFPPAWPLLPDTSGPVTYGDGGLDMTRDVSGSGTWGNAGEDTELGALSKFLGDLGVPSLPGSFLDVLSYFGRGGTGNNAAGVPIPGVTNSQPITRDTTPIANDPGLGNARPDVLPNAAINGKGKAKEVNVAPSQLRGMSRSERYFLAAADQPSGPRASRLAQVIKAKYDAGLLKPYDYVRGYERMNKWMESGRAAPRADSISESAPSSPQKGGKRMLGSTPTPQYGSSISSDSRRRILAALNGFRPKFRQIARTLTDVDLVFVEEAMERWMLEYDRAFASIHTPSCIWRRTGEIQKANQEFANLTGIPASMFRGGQLCVYELMDEESAVKYWEGYGKIAFDAGQRSLYSDCTLKIPMSLIRRRASPASTAIKAVLGRGDVTELSLPQSVMYSGNPPGPPASEGASSDYGYAQGTREEYREIKCCFSVTIRRDAWGVPVAIMGQWIPM